MTISAEVLADSIHDLTRSRLTTMKIRYPRFVHAEVMTHKMLAKNSASSRAIPSKRMRANIRKDPAMPLSWGGAQAGMQQGADLTSVKGFLARLLWLGCMHVALFVSWALDALGTHKALANRVTEPFSHIMVIITGTDRAFANFYALRRHEMAEPTIHALADEMARVHRASVPRHLYVGEWHLPLVPEGERGGLDVVKRSVARVARTSYDKPDGTLSTLAEDIALHERLVGSQPMHASPAEHQACVGGNVDPGLAGCLGPGTGWVQYRKTLSGECVTNLNEVIQ